MENRVLKRFSQPADAEKLVKTLAGEKNEPAAMLADYYKMNQDRMNYPLYGQLGCGMVGSEAGESAHRTVVQKHMKQSGQR